MAEIGKDILKAKHLLMAGELVAIPTETVYGLAGNALDIAAVTKIFTAKERPHFDPLIVHVPSLEQAKKWAVAVPVQAEKLAARFWPGPLTLLLKKKPVVPDLVTSGLDNVGIRCPNHPLTLELLRSLPFPLAAPSANPFGYISPTLPEHVNEQLGDKIKYILDGGPCDVGIESTIIGFEQDKGQIFRLGGLGIESIESIIGPVGLPLQGSSNPQAPGQLKSHYAPTKKMVLGDLETLLQEYPAHCTGILSFQKDYHSPYQIILSPQGNIEEAAQRLFTALRILDKMPIKTIIASPVPDTGLGKAINDRLRRAAADKD